MSKKKNQENLSFFQKHSRFSLTILLFFVIVPIIFIGSLYFYHGVVVSPVLFQEKSNKLSKDMEEYFTINSELIEIRTVYETLTEEEETEGKKAKVLHEQYKFSFEFTINKTVSDITINSISAQLSPRFYTYNSDPKSVTYRTRTEDGQTIYYGEIIINYSFDKTKLPLLSPKEPMLFWKVNFSEKPSASSVYSEYTKFYKINYEMNDVTYL